MSSIAAAESVIPAPKELLDDLNIKDDPRSLGVREADIAALAETCMLGGPASTKWRCSSSYTCRQSGTTFRFEE
jgi:hypothetical protein